MKADLAGKRAIVTGRTQAAVANLVVHVASPLSGAATGAAPAIRIYKKLF